jgi:hypothetical protein
MKNIFEQYDQAQAAHNRVDESGMRNIKALSKQFKTAQGYFHMDTDGVTSAIAMKAYLEAYGIKTTDVTHIQYGAKEFQMKNPKKGQLQWMVDFAHGKPWLNVWTDHHDGQSGIVKGTSTAFEVAPSNATAISAKISPKDLFPAEDLKVISMVDSADFKKNGVTPDEVMNAAFGFNKDITVERNHMMMGLVVNKLLLAYKNKKGFLESLVMDSKPSLISMYNVIKKLAREGQKFKTPAEVGAGGKKYVADQAANGKPPFTLPKNLKGGQWSMWNNTIVKVDAQTGGWQKITYDRYTPFKIHPDSEYIVMGWTMGLVQVSKNPFNGGKNPTHLADLAWKVMKKFEGKLKAIKISVVDLKYKFEQGHTPESMGFRYDDLVALFDKKLVKGIDLEGHGSWNKFIQNLMETPIKQTSYRQKQVMEKVTLNAWDLMQTISGGHKDITNISGFNFLPKDQQRKMFDEVMGALAAEMKDKKLVT